MGRPAGGYYTADGRRVPSVTEILGRFKNADPLVSWAFKRGKESGYATAKGLPATRSAHEEKTQAGQAGNIAHDMIENYILRVAGKVVGEYVYEGPKLPPGLMDRATKGFENGKRWLAGSALTVVDTEVSLVSELHGFGGTRDVRFIDPAGRNRLGDWKTSNSIYADYLLQLGAYSLLAEECEGIEFDGGYDILRFSKEHADFVHKFFLDLSDAKAAFLLLVQAYPLVDKLESRVR